MITIDDPVFGPLFLRKTKTRGLKLAFTKNGFIEIRMGRPSKAKALVYISKNREWIKKYYKPTYVLPGSIIDGFTVVCKSGSTLVLRNNNKLKLVILTLPRTQQVRSIHIQKLLYEHCSEIHKKAVTEDLTSAATHISETIGLIPNDIKTRTMHSRWGSCSSKKNISISSFASYLDEKLFEYLVIHELAHLVHLDHSSKFWSEVEKHCPDYKILKKKLSNSSLRLQPN